MAGDKSTGNDVLLQLITPEEEHSSSHTEPKVEQTLTPRRYPQRLGCLPSKENCLKHIPYFIICTTLIQIIVYILSNASLTTRLIYDPTKKDEVWRFITYMLLHSDSLHLALNIVIQILITITLEIEQGHIRPALVYLGGGLSGSLATSILQPGIYVVGASAGVYSLLISHLANIALNHDVVPYKIHRVIFVVGMVLADIGFTIHHFYLGNTKPQIGWSAHGSGAFSGFLLGFVIYKRLNKNENNSFWQQVIFWISAILLIAGFLAAVISNLLSPVPGSEGK